VFRRHAQLRTFLTVLADAASTTAALVLAYALRFGSGLFPVRRDWHPGDYLAALPPALLLALAAYALVGSYRSRDVADAGDSGLRETAGAVIAAALIVAAGALFYRSGVVFSRGVLLLFPVVGIPVVWSGRLAAGALLRNLHARGVGVRRALLVGSGETADDLRRALEDRAWLGIRIAAVVPDPRDLAGALERHEPGQVFVAFPGDRPADLRAALEALRDATADVRVVPDLSGATTLNPEVALLAGLPVITLRQSPIHGVNRFAKRAFDLTAGLALAILLLPVAILTAVAVAIGSGRPILYSQERMGLDGRRFRILKFRTMRADAEEDGGAVWSRRDDPRTTRVGRVLRRFSLDEVPQLVNVLRGEMSLVGPRPERPVFIEEFRKRLPGYMHRLRIPAGLTGLAQVKGLRGDTDLSERLRYDLLYLERWSLLYDVEILVRTAFRVLGGR